MLPYFFDIRSYPRGAATQMHQYIIRKAGTKHASRDDLVATGHGNLPSFCEGDPERVFAGADKFERLNGAACRAVVISLPKELPPSEWIKLTERFISADLSGKPFEYGIHLPHRPQGPVQAPDVPTLPLDSHAQEAANESRRNPHVHIVYLDRKLDGIERSEEEFFRRSNPKHPELGGCKKDSGGRSRTQMRIELAQRKALWASMTNESLRAHGCDAWVDSRATATGPRNLRN